MQKGYVKRLLSKKKRIHASHLITFFSLTLATVLTLLQVPKIQNVLQHAAATTDIDVLYIERTPRYAYDAAKNLPAQGDMVTFIAHIKNMGVTATGTIPYNWSIDGKIIKSATTPTLNQNQTVAIPLSWQWQTGTHTVKFQADPNNIIAESTKNNNTIEQETNSIGVGFWIEQSLYNWFNSNQNKLGIGSNSFEDWTQRLVSKWNGVFAASVYPSVSQGIKERVHIDEVTIVPDGTLKSKESPNPNDKTVDLEWGLRTSEFLNKGFYDDAHGNPKIDVTEGNPFYVEYGIMHELSHARYLADLYAFDINADPTQGTNQLLVLKKDGTQLVPKGKSYYYICEGGMMGCRTQNPNQAHIYSEDDVFAWNAKLGKRAECGNANPPCDIGTFLNNLPSNNIVKILDQNHQPIDGAKIFIYQSIPNTTSGIWYDKTIDNTPDITCTTDSSGSCSIGSNPFNIHVTKTYDSSDWTRGIIVIKITKNGEEDFRYLFVPQANDEYWRGHQTATYIYDNVNLTGTTIIPSYVCGGSTNGICPTPTPAGPIISGGGNTLSTTISLSPCTSTQSVSAVQEVARHHHHKHKSKNSNDTSLLKEFLDLFQQLIELIDKLLGSQTGTTPTPTEAVAPTSAPTTVPTKAPCPTSVPTATIAPSIAQATPTTALSSTPAPSTIQATPTAIPSSTLPTSTPTPSSTLTLVPTNNPTSIPTVSGVITPTVFETPTPTNSSNPTEVPTPTSGQTPTNTPTPSNNGNFAITILKLFLDFLNQIINLFLSLLGKK